MNSRPVDCRSSETYFHPINMIMIIIIRLLFWHLSGGAKKIHEMPHKMQETRTSALCSTYKYGTLQCRCYHGFACGCFQVLISAIRRYHCLTGVWLTSSTSAQCRNLHHRRFLHIFPNSIHDHPVIRGYAARPEHHLTRPSRNPKFTFNCYTYPTRARLLLFQPEWSPINFRYAPTIVLLMHVFLMCKWR
jgi:hypothetical protein